MHCVWNTTLSLFIQHFRTFVRWRFCASTNYVIYNAHIRVWVCIYFLRAAERNLGRVILRWWKARKPRYRMRCFSLILIISCKTAICIAKSVRRIIKRLPLNYLFHLVKENMCCPIPESVRTKLFQIM